MSKYLTLFDTQENYQTFKDSDSFITPNVTLVTSDMSVHYNPYVDPANGYPYVEIAGIKWATMNVGATSKTDIGLCFQWGDTQGYTASQVGTGSGQKYFGWTDYKYGNGTSSPGAAGMTKYNSTDGKTVLDLEDDAAHVIMGESWRMPTNDELTKLQNNTTHQQTTINGVTCTKFISKTDTTKTLFFPHGSYSNGNVYNAISYWSSSLDSMIYTSKCLNLSESIDNRYCGFPVRGVLDV